MARVLVTGGSGFVASHVIKVLLQRGHSVVATVRSEAKGERIRKSHKDSNADQLNYVIVPDMAAPGAFKSLGSYALDAVIHVASPFFYNTTDPVKDLVNPAILGTTGVLEAIKDFCPTVKRVVVTSSFAAILNPFLGQAGTPKVYSEADWSPLTLEDATNGGFAYVVSKKLAEQAAWDFVRDKSPAFSLAIINPPMVYGPVLEPPSSLENVNTSSQIFAELILGKYYQKMPPTSLPLFVDVRDAALAHVKAMEIDEAGGKRFFITGGHYSNKDIVEIVRQNFPDLHDKLPDEKNPGGEPNPNIQSFGYDVSRATEILGMKWTPFENTVVDAVKSLSVAKNAQN